ncbi:MAG: enoyl-CoA hydratase/isomerase family protein [Phycisphaerales bacterium JB065]
MIDLIVRESGTDGVKHGFAEVVLNRPEKRNALTPEMLRQFIERIEEAGADDRAGAVLVRGEGKSFCAGFDLTLCKENSDALAAMLTGLSEAVRTMRRLGKPVVVAAHGHAVAGGCALLGGADLVIADRALKLGYPVVKMGISPAVSAPFVRQALASTLTRGLLLEPELIDGDRAREMGLVRLLVDLPEDVTPRGQIEAQKFASKPPRAMSATRKWLTEIEGLDRDSLIDRALGASLELVGSPEERERLAAIWSA